MANDVLYLRFHLPDITFCQAAIFSHDMTNESVMCFIVLFNVGGNGTTESVVYILLYHTDGK